MDALDELKQIAQNARDKKGRMDAAQRKAASEALVVLLSDPARNLSETLQIAENIQSEAFAEAISKAWQTMSTERRLQSIRSLPPPDSERTKRRILLVAARIADEDSGAATELLDRLVPDSAVGKELGNLLIGTLFHHTGQFNFVALAASPTGTGLRVMRKLSRLAFDPGNKIDQDVRYEIAVATITLLRSDSLETSQRAELLRILIPEVERWSSSFRSQFEAWLRDAAPHLIDQFFALRRPIQLGQAAVTSSLQVSEHPKDAPGEDLENYFGVTIERLRADLNEAVHAHKLYKETLQKKQAQFSQAKAREHSLSVELRNAESAKTAAEHVAEQARSQLRELESQIQQIRREHEQERNKLTQQIGANADGRIREFQNQLAMTLARQLTDLPPRDTNVSAELGAVLLLQFYQLIDLLAQHGVLLPSRTKR